jgi:anti-anti-sigma regulatory factor
MEEELEKQPLYSVGITESSALLRICGRASYLNCASLSEFFQKCNKTEIIIDFKECLGMDSTFLGIIAGASLEMQRIHKDSRLILVHLSERNLELIKNLGLHLICQVDLGKSDPYHGKSMEELEFETSKEAASRLEILGAHETLSSLNAKNAQTFKEVLIYLRQKAEDERPL